MNLLPIRRPSRYINNEVNSAYRNAPLKVALAFPDIYDVGMSHLGLKVLYEIINEIPYASAERVFSPWTDLEEAMKKNGLPLSSLETGTPLSSFDIVGFSLQYELSYTTVLNMLSLGGIPLRSEERMDRKKGPLVIAGGPCTLNPFPISPFIDAFLVGDGEEAIKEIIDLCHEWKRGGQKNRESLLKSLSLIEGVFVPSLGREKPVKRRILPSLENAPFPEKPVVPYAAIIHDRVNIEISRGCSMGCRFCQAGMAYRPVRERTPEKILELAERSLRNTGYEDISFTSLSSGDYSCLPYLMKEFNRRFAGKRIAMSLPSLRVASVNSDMLKEIRAVRKTGFTIAPEAGTDRLRAVINKDVTEEMYLRALEVLFKEGWHNLKLYFMTGLPTETDADLSAIPDMVYQAIKTSRKLTGRNITISVGVSSFVPKPHTPFQWFGQNSLEALREKNDFLKKSFLKKGVKYKGHNEEMSVLEAAFARGDEALSKLLEAAWKSGCRLDAWTEVFDFQKWMKAMDIAQIDAADYAMRDYALDSTLPWDNISTGVTKDYLRQEYLSAVSANVTSDCRKKCHNCGLKCAPRIQNAEPASAAEPGQTGPLSPAGSFLKQKQLNNIPARVRIQYSKTGKMRYLSHLELTRAILRAMRRAGLPLKYSAGFHPSPRISFGPALGVGVAGLREYLDLELLSFPSELQQLMEDLNRTLPEGLRIGKIVALYGKERSLDSFIMRYTYKITCDEPLSAEGFLKKDNAIVSREKGTIDIKALVEEIESLDEKTVLLTVRDNGNIRVRLDEIVPEIFNIGMQDVEITRTASYGWDGGWVEPMEGEKAWAAKSL